MQAQYYYALGFSDIVSKLFLQIYVFFFRINVYVFPSFIETYQDLWGFLTKKRKIVLSSQGTGQVYRKFYDLNQLSLELTEQYYEKNYAKKIIWIQQIELLFNTQKFQYHLKQFISYQIFHFLNALSFTPPDGYLFVIDNSLHRYLLDQHDKKHQVRFVNAFAFECILVFLYIAWLFSQLLRHKITFSTSNQSFRIYKEAGEGLDQKSLREDVFIDGEKIQKDDVLYYRIADTEYYRNRAFEQVKAAGYHTVDLKKVPIFFRNLPQTFKIYFFLPIRLFYEILIGEQSKQHGYLSIALVSFFTRSFKHFVLLSRYHCKVHISIVDRCEAPENIIMNYLGCQNVLYHWSDMTVLPTTSEAYACHDLYLCWGRIHYELYQKYKFFDRVETIGCFLLSNINYIKTDKKNRVLICDTSFGNLIHFTPMFYIQYLELVWDLVQTFKEVQFYFKPKNIIHQEMFEEELRQKFETLWHNIKQSKNFTNYEYGYPIEDAIGNADLVLNMGMNSPATLAIMAGIDAFYYDLTGNNTHPFTRFKHQVVFDDPQILKERLLECLTNKYSVFDVIPKELLDQYLDQQNNSQAKLLLSKHIAALFV